VVATTAHNSANAAKAAAAKAAAAGHAVTPTKAQMAQAQKAITDHALSVGFSRGFVVSAGIMLVGLLVAVLMVRVTRQDLAEVKSPMTG